MRTWGPIFPFVLLAAAFGLRWVRKRHGVDFGTHPAVWRAGAGIILLGMAVTPLAIGVDGLSHSGGGGVASDYVGIGIGITGMLFWLYVPLLWWRDAHAPARPPSAGSAPDPKPSGRDWTGWRA
jgi:hypothetical protein